MAGSAPPAREAVRMLKETLLADRLQLPRTDVQTLLQAIQSDFANAFELSPATAEFELEFLGRNVDLVFTIARRNLPKE